jgi:hypothetical protein
VVQVYALKERCAKLEVEAQKAVLDTLQLATGRRESFGDDFVQHSARIKHQVRDQVPCLQGKDLTYGYGGAMATVVSSGFT